MSTVTKPDDSKSGYVRYAVLLGLLAAIRILEAVIANSTWRLEIGDASWGMFWGMIALAASVSLATCLYARTKFSKVTAALLGMLAGGTATLVMSSIPGMVVGLVVASLAAFDVTQRLSIRALKLIGVIILPAAVGGFGMGYFGAKWNWLRVDPNAEFGMANLVFGLLLVTSMVYLGLLIWLRKEHAIHLLWKFPLFFLVCLIAEPNGIDQDTMRRMNRLVQGNVHVYGPPTAAPFYQRFVRGFLTPTDISIDEGLTAEQGKLLAKLPSPKNVFIQQFERNTDFHSAGFAEANFRGVVFLRGHSKGMNDQALLGFQESEKMFELHMDNRGGTSGITDAGLAALGNMKVLTNLTLIGQNIDGSGLQHLHPDAPLQYLSLNDTNVSDDALKHLANHDVGMLSLAGTKVTGAGLVHVVPKTTMGLTTLHLSRAPVKEEHFAAIPKSVMHLRLNGTTVTESGAKLLAKLPILENLSLQDSSVDDKTVEKLAPLKLKHLEIDAAKLTVASCGSLAKVPGLELHYEADDWLASGRSLDDLIAHFEMMRDEIGRQRNQMQMPPSERALMSSIQLGIRHLVVKQEMVERLVSLPDCSLITATLSEGSSFLKGERAVQDVDPSDLHRWFPRANPVEELRNH